MKFQINSAAGLNIGQFTDFFKQFGFDCPLTKHLKRTVNSGFPRYSLFVDARFMAEMCAGILVEFGGGKTEFIEVI